MKLTLAPLCTILAASALCAAAQTNPPAAFPDWLTRPLSLADALNLTEQHNATILKAKQDLAATAGVAIQTRAVVVPKVRATSSYQVIDRNSIDALPVGDLGVPGMPPFSITYADQGWSADVQLVQSVYEGGALASSLRTARLLNDQAVLQFQTTLADTLTDVRVAYYDVLLAAMQVEVEQASQKLLTNELEDTQRRYEAGTVPRFNVLRAEVELANGRPRLIRAENNHRLAKNRLSNLLGFDLPRNVWEDIPLHLSGQLEYAPYSVDLSAAIETALRQRTELAALRKAESLRDEAVTRARAGYRPRLQVFAGYGAHSSQFGDFVTRDLYGWSAGAQVTWDIFDGLLTKGKVDEATALQVKARRDLEDVTRRIELEVRARYSDFVEASQVLESQRKVQEEAAEALRLAQSRMDAGTGTQLDVLGAQTSLTAARSTQVQALHDYAVAVARLERAIGSTTPAPTAAQTR